MGVAAREELSHSTRPVEGEETGLLRVGLATSAGRGSHTPYGVVVDSVNVSVRL